jgi:hypothetical protein
MPYTPARREFLRNCLCSAGTIAAFQLDAAGLKFAPLREFTPLERKGPAKKVIVAGAFHAPQHSRGTCPGG